MASKNTVPDPMISCGESLIQAIRPHRRKHRNSAVAVGFRLRGAQKKYLGNGYSVNRAGLQQEKQVSARKLAAGLWQQCLMEDDGAALRSSSSRSSMSQLESSMPRLKCTKEDATKWNPAKWNPALNNKASKEFSMIHNKKNFEDKNFNLNEQNVFWRCTECQKIETMLENLKEELARERKSRERMELLNTKLVHELNKANLSAEQIMANYEKEKEEKELIAKMCNDLAMQIGEDKARLEGLLSYSMKIRDEVEEERKMMQMAELWREERVQMKLIDAQFVLEDKYNQMIQLIAFLQMLLRSRGAKFDSMELDDAQLIKKVVESVNIQRIAELSYDFLELDNIISIFEELRKCNTEDGMIEPHNSYSTFTSNLSSIHIENLDEEVFNKNPMMHQSSPPMVEQQFVNVNQDKEGECSKKTYIESLRTGVNEGCTLSTGQLKWKASIASKQLKSCHNGGTTICSSKSSQHKRVGDGWYKQKECDHRLSTSSVQNGRISSSTQCKGSDEGGFKHSELLGQGNSANNMNPHITRGMKGCTEWPRGTPKSNFKVIPFGRKSEKSKISLATHT